MIEHPESGPRSSMMASDAKMVVNWTDKGLRAAGTVEIAGPRGRAELETRRDPARPPPQHVSETAEGSFRPSRIKTWFGHRPSMPDGRPCIGYSRASRDIVYAFGHGHVGLVGSARTGRLVAQLLSGNAAGNSARAVRTHASLPR